MLISYWEPVCGSAGPSDRTLIYLELCIGQFLKRLEGCKTKADGYKVRKGFGSPRGCSLEFLRKNEIVLWLSLRAHLEASFPLLFFSKSLDRVRIVPNTPTWGHCPYQTLIWGYVLF